MTPIENIALAARIAARDMRGGARALWLLVAGVFIGSAAVALVGATSQSLIDGARKGALVSVGGDISLRLFHRPPSEAELAIVGRKGDLSISAELRPMVRAIKNGQAVGTPLLVELKGIDDAYPLYGAVDILPASNLHQMLDRQDGVYGAVADPALFDALGLNPGDAVQIGDARYRLRGTLVSEPDRAFRAFTLGPRLMVLGESLAATGVAGAGAEAYFYTRLKLPASARAAEDAKAALAQIDQAFPNSGWRMVNAHDGVPGVERTLAMAHAVLLFIGLGVMLVGGAGISGAVRAHVASKIKTIAILKSIGAAPAVVTLAMGVEVLAAAMLGAVLGAGLGAVGPTLIVAAFGDHLPFTLDTAPAIKPLLSAGLFGVLVAALFAWWPLMVVHQMTAQMLLRDRVTQSAGKQGVKGWLGSGGVLTVILALVFWVSPLPVLTVAFLIGALVLTAFYYALGVGLSRLARVLAKGKGAKVRLALGNLYRAGTPTGPVVMALGLTLTLLVALQGLGGAASRHLQETLPDDAPDLVAFSLKAETARRLGTDLATTDMVKHQRIMPFLHARVQAIGGVAVRDLKIPGSISWVIRGDRGVSFSKYLDGGAVWLPGQSDQPGFSIAADVARKLGIGLGDTITLNLSGHVRTAPVLNMRPVDWTRLALDFPIIATPGTFAGIPYTYAASLKAEPGEAVALETHIKNTFPQVPLIRVGDVVQSLARALDAIVAGLQTAALMCGLAALMVLAGSVLQGLRVRTNEAVLFKVLGARKGQLLGQLTVEFLSLGTLVALVAVPLGLSVAYGVARVAGLGAVTVSWGGGFALAVAAIFVTLAVGVVMTLGAYTTPPARALRNRLL